MFCQECKMRPATVHLTKIINNVKQERHLCEVCAREADDFGISMEPKFTFHHLLTGLLGTEGTFYPGGEARAYKGDIQCKNCSLTYPQFRQIGRLGCSQCYDAFESYLTPLLKRIHGSSRHNGKMPHRVGDTVRLKKQVEQLREKLQQKIAREEFEEAARIRDEIRMLEKKVSGGE